MRAELWPGDHTAEVEQHLRDGATPLLTLVLVADRGDGKLCGFVEIGLRPYAEGCDSSPVPFIEGWYVDPDVRGTGVGRELIRAAEAWARANGYREIASDVELDNDASIAAHNALGFEEVDRLVCFRKGL